MTTITIREYNSQFFPIAIEWKTEFTTHGNVFETKERAINWAEDRFGKIRVIDKTRKGN